MENKNAIIAAVVVIIVIIAAVGAYLAFGGGDDSPSEETGDTYYFYLNGFEGDADGWYQATGDDAADAAADALADSGLTYTVDGGWISFEGYDGSYDAATGTGTGVGIYVYTSTDVAQPYAGYFFAGPTLDKVTGNIVYITYSEYTMDMETYETTYAGGPASDTEWMTTGPFAVGADYQPLSYSGTFYFYLNGFEGDADGWYQATGDNAAEAIVAALEDSGLTYTVDGGWISFEGYDGSYDAATGTGTGTGIFVYSSTDVAQPYAGYFFAGPTLDKVAGNIVYITYSAYTMDMETYETTYAGGPASVTEWMTTGPFTA